MSDDVYAVPALLGRYRPQTVIGRGGMAMVFRAVDESLGREVAVKLFRAGEYTDFVRHEAEIRVLAGLNHHGIVTLIDAGIDDSAPDERRPFLVMELVNGQNLERGLAERSFNAREISEIAYDTAEALEYVHAQGVVHRDIKPSNIMLVDYGTSTFRTRARLTDFGIALDSTAIRVTTELATAGTAAYLSPEQVRREPLTSASDVYALGLVLLQAFTGRIAFPGSIVESALARLEVDPEVPEGLPDDWSNILRQMTARDPVQRPPIGELTPLFRQAVAAASAKHKHDGNGEDGSTTDGSMTVGLRSASPTTAGPMAAGPTAAR